MESRDDQRRGGGNPAPATTYIILSRSGAGYLGSYTNGTKLLTSQGIAQSLIPMDMIDLKAGRIRFVPAPATTYIILSRSGAGYLGSYLFFTLGSGGGAPFVCDIKQRQLTSTFDIARSANDRVQRHGSDVTLVLLTVRDALRHILRKKLRDGKRSDGDAD